MRIIIIAALLAATSLVACGGGGSSSPGVSPTPVPTATPTPRVISAHLSWFGPAHSSVTSASSAHRNPLAISSPEPIEIGAAPSDSRAFAATNGETAASLVVSFTDQNGSPAPAPSGTPSVTIADSSVASQVPQPTPSPNPSASPGPVSLAIVTGGGSTGTTTITATIGGATSSIGVRAYSDPTLECPAALHPGSVEGLQIVGGSFAAATSATADFYLTGPACADKSTTATTLHAPSGFYALSDATPISSVAIVDMAHAPTMTVALSGVFAAPSTYGVLVVKGASGDYGKFRVGATFCSGDQSLCDNAAALGTFAAYGPLGSFPF